MAKIQIGKLLYKLGIDKDGKFDVTLKKTEAQVKKLGVQMNKTNNRFQKFGNGLLSLKTAMIGFFAGAVIQGIRGLVQLGGESQRAELSFNALNRSIGDDAVSSLNKMRVATNGLVTDLELMRAGSAFVGLGLAKTGDDMAELANKATVLGRAFGRGQGAAASMEQFGLLLANQSILRLDTFGISGDTVRTKIEKLQKANEGMTRQQAFLIATMEEADVAMKNLGKTAFTATERSEMLNVKFKNMKALAGKALIPTFEMLVDSLSGVGNNAEATEEKFEQFSLGIYKGTNAVISFFKALGIIIKGFVAFAKISFNAFKTFSSAVGVGKDVFLGFSKAMISFFKGDFKKAKEELTASIKDPFKKVQSNFNDLKNEVLTSSDKMADSMDSFNESAQKMYGKGFASSFNKLSQDIDGVRTQITENNEVLDESGDASDKAKEKTDDWTATIKKARDEAKKLAESLSGDLSESFDEYSKSLADNIKETNDSLADIVIEAEKRRAEIKNELREVDTKDEKTALKNELKGIEEVLDAREDFEKEHLEKITSIRTKLTEAGLDPNALGIGDGTNSGLEDTIAEKRRVASLDEFTRFKEQQFKKLDILTNDFVTETALYESKITKQKQLEVGFTSFLDQEIKSRQALMSAMSMGNFAKPVSAVSGARTGASSGGSVTNNSIQVSNNIGGTLKEMNAEELTAVMSFELDKHL